MTSLTKRNSNAFIIGEVGSNWKRDISPIINYQNCIKFIEAAKEAKCDAVKFQLFTHKELYGFEGQEGSDAYSLPKEWIPNLKHVCDQVGIEFMCTAFSEEGYDYVDRFVNYHKIASSENSHDKLINQIEKYKKVTFISLGGVNHKKFPFIVGYQKRNSLLIPMACIVEYPALPEQYHLSYLSGYNNFGLSDHTMDFELAIMAIGMGSRFFEKHFDIFGDDKIQSPDSPHSINLNDLKNYVNKIKKFTAIAEDQLDEYIEQESKRKYRRRIKAIRDIYPGDILVYGSNFGVYRSKEDDLHAASGEVVYKFMNKISTKRKQIGEGLFYTDIE